MNPFVSVIVGDALQSLATLEAESVQTCVTSPPYWGLRDYQTGTWEGGEEGCDHIAARIAIGNSPSSKSTLTTNNGKGPKQGDKFSAGSQVGYAHECSCGAKRTDAQLGLEATPEAYVAAMVAVFREVRRVLREDGTLWLNLGDSYAASGPAGGQGKQYTNAGSVDVPVRRPTNGCKPKDLVGIPWMVAFALRADGWYLRQDIIWAKPNPMPESVRDRCTKSHEYLFLLSKQPRYYYDAAAIAEATEGREIFGNSRKLPHDDRNDIDRRDMTPNWSRNKRSVWTVATEPYPEAHFATFPTALIRPCVLAGSREGDTVLDPFAGSGTTLEVAQRLGRKAIGIELNPAYAELIRKRIASVPAPMFSGGL